MSKLREGYSEEISMSKDDALSFIHNILRKEILSGNIKPGEYIIVDDDGIFVGNESDFDSDVLLYAVKIDDIVDFDNINTNNDFIDFSNIETDKLLSNLS